VVTYTGNGTSQTISHNLGANVGFMVVKKTSATGSWIAWHREFADTAQGRLLLNETSSYNFASSYWNNTAPTSSGFTVGSNANTNASGSTYVAYLFAHNDGDGEFGPSGDQDIIKCGSYTGNGSTTGPVIDLGFEPQWVLIKESSNTGNWQLFDNMRGMVADGVDARIAPNVSSAEDSIQSLTPTATGFKINTTSGNMNTNNSDHIYMAIRSPSAPAITWPTNIEWASGVTPSTPAEGETDVYTFTTDDGGTTYTGIQSIDNAS
jgi:hypothetical protein